MTPHRRAGTGLSLFFVLASAAGCGRAIPTESDATFVARQLAEAACGYTDRCGIPSGESVGQSGECVGPMQHHTRRIFGPYDAVIARGTTRLDEAALARCTSALRAAPCETRTVVFLFAGLPECQDLFVGSLPDGEACTFSAECESGLCVGPTDECGTCTPRLALGASCDPTLVAPFCDRGLYCDGSGHCVARVGLGGECDPSNGDASPRACEHLLLCQPDPSSPTRHVCGHLPVDAEGAPCPLDTVCAPGFVCGSVDGVGTRCRRPRTDGTCDAQIAGPGTDCPDGECVMGRCVPYPSVGESCELTRACRAPAFCALASMCVVPHALGEPCTLDSDCESDHCTAGRCAEAALCN
ncbi:MAG: hypothetical protein U0234_07110 [Sandaracinus sp.]